MKYVILRDDDTNALTPVECLDRLYRPFLDRSLPVNLAVIPNVRTDITYGAGTPEGFLVAKTGISEKYRSIESAKELVAYLRSNAGFTLVQHGYTHEFTNGHCEFELADRIEVARRFSAGRACFNDAGFPEPNVFVAPYDRFTPASLVEAAGHYQVISTSWFEWRKLPATWWPRYFVKKLLRWPHWRIGKAILLSHPGCHLSYHRDYASMLSSVITSIEKRKLTVLVTHWWEFFRDNQADQAFIDVLHRLADFLAGDEHIKVASFQDVASGRVPLR